MRLIYRDDESRPETSAAAAVDLIENEGVNIIVGAVSSSATLAVAKVCSEKSVLLMSPSASTPSSARPATTSSASTLGHHRGTAMAEFAKNNGVRRVVIFAINEEFGTGLTNVFRRRFESKSRTVMDTFYFPPDAGPTTSLR